MNLVIAEVNVDLRPAAIWPGAGGAVSIDERIASSVSCRSGWRPVMLLLSMLSAWMQLFPEEERRSWGFRPEQKLPRLL